MAEKICWFEGCGASTAPKSSLCPGHKTQKARGKTLTPIRRSRLNLEDRFWEKVDKSGECWTWQAGQTSTGYGAFSIIVDGKSTMAKAHRVSYEMEFGPIPDGDYIDHICHTPLCVRPEHLRAVTQKQNMEHRSGLNSNNISGARGVYWHKAMRRWCAVVKHRGINIVVGYFENESEAGEAARAKRLELFTHNNADRRAA